MLVCHADTIAWTNAAGGSFQEPLNWLPNQVPTATDTALFELTDGPYTVTWEEDITNHTQLVNAGTVTFDLKGYTYSLDRLSTNTIGMANNMTLVTFTNGTVERVNGSYTGNTLDQRFYLRGSGSTLHLRNVNYDKMVYYYASDVDTQIVIDGPEASLTTVGYSTQSGGDLIVTNGGYFLAENGFKFTQPGAKVHVSGLGSSAGFSVREMHSSVSILMDNGAVVKNTSAATPYSSYSGTITLNDARWHTGYAAMQLGWIGLEGEDALLQGSGTVEMKNVIMNGGTIRPGCEQQAGLLIFGGQITNAVETSVFEMELGGPDPTDYDRIRLVTTTKYGQGTFYAGGILNVTAINGYEPELPTTFKLIDAAGGIEFTFDQINLPWAKNGWDTTALYTSGEITYTPQRGTAIIIR